MEYAFSFIKLFFLEDYYLEEIIKKMLKNYVKLVKTHIDEYRVFSKDIAH